MARAGASPGNMERSDRPPASAAMRLLSHNTCVCLLLAGAAVAGLVAADAPAKLDPQHLAALIKQLGHEEFLDREAASRELEAAGEQALPALRGAAATDGSPEVRLRAERALRAILWGNRTSKSTGLVTVPVPAGEFVMGAPKGQAGRRPDEAQHKVRIGRPFLIGVHEVTQEEYQKVTETNPSGFAATGESRDRVKGVETKRFPVESVSWFDAVEFCNRLSALDGHEPYYKVADAKRESGSVVAATVTVLGGHGYRLPTEAEWEYACRAGGTRAFHFGDFNTGRQANLKPSASAGGYGGPPAWTPHNRPVPVGSYKPSRWTLFDTHGNVGEWCGDWYDKDYYAAAPEGDPPGPDKGTQRVVRGGSWMVAEESGRSASRLALAPGERKDYVGFRVARTP